MSKQENYKIIRRDVNNVQANKSIYDVLQKQSIITYYIKHRTFEGYEVYPSLPFIKMQLTSTVVITGATAPIIGSLAGVLIWCIVNLLNGNTEFIGPYYGFIICILMLGIPAVLFILLVLACIAESILYCRYYYYALSIKENNKSKNEDKRVRIKDAKYRAEKTRQKRHKRKIKNKRR